MRDPHLTENYPEYPALLVGGGVEVGGLEAGEGWKGSGRE